MMTHPFVPYIFLATSIVVVTIFAGCAMGSLRSRIRKLEAEREHTRHYIAGIHTALARYERKFEHHYHDAAGHICYSVGALQPNLFSNMQRVRDDVGQPQQ